MSPTGPTPAQVLAARDTLLAAASDGRLDALAEEHGLRLATLHGSAVAHDDPRDLDVGIGFVRGTRGNLPMVITSLVGLVGIDAVDVMDVDRASVVARARALGHGALPLYERVPGLWAREQMAALGLEMELAPMRARQLQLMAEG